FETSTFEFVWRLGCRIWGFALRGRGLQFASCAGPSLEGLLGVLMGGGGARGGAVKCGVCYCLANASRIAFVRGRAACGLAPAELTKTLRISGDGRCLYLFFHILWALQIFSTEHHANDERSRKGTTPASGKMEAGSRLCARLHHLG